MTGNQPAERLLSVQPDGARAAVLASHQRSGGVTRWLRKYWLDVAMVTPLFLYILFFMLVPVDGSYHQPTTTH